MSALQTCDILLKNFYHTSLLLCSLKVVTIFTNYECTDLLLIKKNLNETVESS